jgi:murein DD-endopeptidase MepM/ murein hydrolase activator NlpD
MMRLASALVCLTFAAAACSRPVLYYPTDGPAPAPAPKPATSVPVVPATPVAVDPEAASLSDTDYLRSRHLVVPVAGANMARVEDSYFEPRDGGERTHRALDILAPRGTPILSADDGRILRMSNSSLGGITMYTVDPANRIVYYYAHMDHYNDVMSPGRTITRGDTLGFVGTTGNAPKDTPHLHFQIMRWPSDGKYWNGDPIDPFDFLGGVRHGHDSGGAERRRDEPSSPRASTSGQPDRD